MNVKEALAQLKALGNEAVYKRNAKNGAGKDQYGVQLGDIRKLAAKIKADHELGLALWETGNLDARLLAILLLNPKKLSATELDRMVRSATFPWLALQRQATVIGTVELLPREDTAVYWRSRPRGSQLGAWASPQSGVLRDRAALEELLASVTERFADDEEIPPPPHWGGWRIVPTHVEFWQGRSDRLHDRLRFRRTDPGWVVERLAP